MMIPQARVKAHALDIAVVAGKKDDQEKNHEKGQAEQETVSR